jgi:hypothetical protein
MREPGLNQQGRDWTRLQHIPLRALVLGLLVAGVPEAEYLAELLDITVAVCVQHLLTTCATANAR